MKKKRIKTGGRKNSYGEPTATRTYRCPKSQIVRLDQLVREFLNHLRKDKTKR